MKEAIGFSDKSLKKYFNRITTILQLQSQVSYNNNPMLTYLIDIVFLRRKVERYSLNPKKLLTGVKIVQLSQATSFQNLL
jgi:hypothetical protein